MVNKLCCTCGQILPLEQFPLKPSGRHEAECTECFNKEPLTRQRPKILGKSPIPPRLAGLNQPVSPPPTPPQIDDNIPNGMKNCKECGQNKPIMEFHKTRETPDGYKNICRSCSGERFHESVNKKALEWWEKCIKDYSKDQEWFTARQMKTIMQYSLSFSRLVLNRLTEIGLLEKKTMNRVKYYRNKCRDSEFVLNKKLTALAK